jgi:tetratricopeptide (TPR) repeat protein
MTNRWERLNDLYHSAVALPTDERVLLVAEACADDPALQADIERLIAAYDRANPPVEEPIPAEPEPEPAAPVITDRIGPYRLLKELGRGPLGTSYLATRADGPGENRVAVTPVDRDGDAEVLLDGLRAAHQSLGSREHPNVARLIAVATADDGRSYVVMEYIDGEPIDSFADGRRLSIAERLELFVQVCNAVAYAHRCRVVHGGLHPASIHVTGGGVPKLLDFGTSGHQATVADDIRSLGAVLYTLLGSETTDGQRRPLREDLDAVVRTALQQEPRRRYDSAEHLADDVRRCLDGLSARPRPTKRRERSATGPTRARNAVVAWVAAAIAVAALGFKVAPLVTRRIVAAPVPVPVATPPARERVAVADLTNHAGDAGLVAMLSDALRTGLAESPAIVVSTNRQRADAQITGTIDSVGNGYSISLQVTKENGERLPTLVETATDSAGVVHVLADLSRRVREQIGESPTSIADTPQLQDVTTPSLPALRAYAAGSRAIASGERAAGLRSLSRAVALDTGFATAHRLMATTYAEAGDRARSADALDHAIANQTRLPYFTRYHTVASYAMTVFVNHAAAIDAYNQILDRYPNDMRALEGLGRAHAARREYAVQESLMVRAIAVDASVPALHTGLVLARVNQGKYDDARRALDRAQERFPGVRGNALAAVSLAAAKLDWQSAEREAGARFAPSVDDTTDALDGVETLANIRMTQGRLGEAERDLRRVVASGSRRGSSSRALNAAVRLAYVELRYRRSPNAAVRTMNAALTRYPLARIPESERPYDEIARLYADAGQPARALELIAESARTRVGRARASDANRRWTLGVIATAEGRAWEGEIEINGAAQTHPCPICVLPDLARAYEVAGKPDLAIATYERYLNTPWQRRYETDAIELGVAMERLGALYQQQRNNAKAGALYGSLLQLWRGADADLEPVVADVRQRLEQTGGTASR